MSSRLDTRLTGGALSPARIPCLRVCREHDVMGGTTKALPDSLIIAKDESLVFLNSIPSGCAELLATEWGRGHACRLKEWFGIES